MKGGKHSTSNYKPALSSFDPQGTKAPRVTRIGGAVVTNAGDKIGGRSTKPGKPSESSFMQRRKGGG